MSEWFDKDSAKNDSNQFTGYHKVKIKEAEKVTTDAGSEGIKIKVSMLDRLNLDGNPKEIFLETVWLIDKNGKRPDADRISALFMICGASHKKVKKMKVERYDFDTKQKEMKAVPMYEELIGKTVGMFIQLQKKFPLLKIDPATNYTATYDTPGIYIPNYEKERKLAFVFIRAFYADTRATYSEKSANRTAKIVYELTERYHDLEEEQLPYEKFVELIKKRAEAAGLNYNPQLFEYRDTESSDIPELPEELKDNNGNDDVPF